MLSTETDAPQRRQVTAPRDQEVERVEELISCQAGSDRNLVLEAVTSGDLPWQRAFEGAGALLNKHGSLLAEESFRTLDALSQVDAKSLETVQGYLAECISKQAFSGRSLDTALQFLSRDEQGTRQIVEVLKGFDYGQYGSTSIAERFFEFVKELPVGDLKTKCLLTFLEHDEVRMVMPEKIGEELIASGAEQLGVVLTSLDVPMNHQMQHTLSKYFAAYHEEAMPRLQELMNTGTLQQRRGVAQSLLFVNCAPQSSKLLLEEICTELERYRPKIGEEAISTALVEEEPQSRTPSRLMNVYSALSSVPYLGGFFAADTATDVVASDTPTPNAMVSEEEVLLLMELCVSLSHVTLRDRDLRSSDESALLLHQENVEYLAREGFEKLSTLHDLIGCLPSTNFTYQIPSSIADAFQNALLEQEGVSGILHAAERYRESSSVKEKEFILELLSDVSHNLAQRLSIVTKRDEGRSDDISPFGLRDASEHYDKESLQNKFQCLQALIPELAFDIDRDPELVDVKFHLADRIKEERERLTPVALAAFPLSKSKFTQQRILAVLGSDESVKREFHHIVDSIVTNPADYSAELYGEALKLVIREELWGDRYFDLVKTQYEQPVSSAHQHVALGILKERDPSLSFIS